MKKENIPATRLSIVIPVYNGEKTITGLCEKLITSISELTSLEIVLINDASEDNSEQVCIDLYNRYPRIISFYSLAKNVGEHNAVMAGLNQSTGDHMVIMDDDNQNPASEVVKLYNYFIQNNFDVVYTWYEKKNDSFFRNLMSRFNDRMANLMLGKPKDLYLSSFKIMNRFLVDEIRKYDLPYPYIDGLILRTTGNIGKFKVDHNPRLEGSSNYTFRKLFRLWMNMFTNFSILPLRITVFAGLGFAAFGFIYAIYTVIEKLLDPSTPVGYPSIIVAILLFSGIQLISIGMVGEYIGRMFMSQNKKPQYSIRKSFVSHKN